MRKTYGKQALTPRRIYTRAHAFDRHDRMLFLSFDIPAAAFYRQIQTDVVHLHEMHGYYVNCIASRSI
jgi:hypothetical protein